MTTPAQRPTTAAVVAFAANLRMRAAKIKARDVYAEPYVISDAGAKKLVQREGPERALQILRERMVEWDLRYREEEERSDRAHKRWERQMRIADQHLQQQRRESSYVKRIADALAGLSTVSALPAFALDTDQVTGNTNTSTGPRPDDPLARAMITVRLCAESVERELDDARRRAVARVQPDRDARLRELLRRSPDLTPEQIAISDPSQGSPGSIRRRLRELGL